MSAAVSARPLVNIALPEAGLQRFAVQAALAIAGTMVLTIAAKTKVPLGFVDLNLGTLAVFLIAASFGSRLGLATLALWLAEGAAGLPVFQGTPERGIGLAYMVGTTGGYLAGYVVAMGLVGLAADRGWDRGVLKLGAVMGAGAALILALGWAWLATIIGAEKALVAGVMPFLLGDAIKVALAATLVPAVWGLLPERG